jgi:opacity protein-like surface antigen
MDEQQVHGNEFAAKLTARPCRWFRSSLRYQFRDDDYRTRVENQPVVETEVLSHTYTVDVSAQPVDRLLATAAFSRQDAWTRTPARHAAGTGLAVPAFDADVNSWLVTADYAVTPQVSLWNRLLVSWADNFNETGSDVRMMFGVDERRTDVVSGVRWAPREDLSVDAEYAFYRYQPNSNAAAGDYDAHMVSFGITTTF